ncbi:MAG: hypothetical protein LBR89_04165 [Holosporales bacterium]|jgi:hypothetical protein|nr:hypothetical protein [Holosporales bacterium]
MNRINPTPSRFVKNRGRVHFSDLKERVTLISKKSVADDSGKMQIVEIFSAPSWAYIEPLHNCGQTQAPLSSPTHKRRTIFRIFVRARYDIQENHENTLASHSPNRHAKINALRWKHIEYELLCPFSASDKTGHFWEALCVERGEEHG